MNIAIFSPTKNPYSETFIQAHKNCLKGNIFYYYGEVSNLKLEGQSGLTSYYKRIFFELYKLLFNKNQKFLSRKKIEASLIKNKIDVILVEYANNARNLLPFIKGTNIPVVIHFHGLDASKYQLIEKPNIYKPVFSYAAKVVVVSRKMEQMVLGLGCPKEKLIYNVYGPQPEFETVTPTFSKKQFIAIGRFTDKKAPYYTILAFKDVLKKHPDAKLLMAGDGELFNMSKNLIHYYNLENSIKLLGVIKPEDYRKLLAESRAFVQHSIKAEDGDMEGTPLAILEASAAGLPIISTLHAGIPDVIIDGKTGLLSKEHDVKDMTQNMISLLEDKDLAIKMGAVGKINIMENYTLDRHISVLQEILLKAVR